MVNRSVNFIPMSSPVSQGVALIEAAGLTQAAVASAAGVSAAAVSQWVAGTKKPGPAARHALQKAFQFPVDAWDQKPRGKQRKTTAARPAPTPEPEPRAAKSLSETEPRPACTTTAAQLLARHRAARHAHGTSFADVIRIAQAELRLLADMVRAERPSEQLRIQRSAPWRVSLERVSGALSDAPELAQRVTELVAAHGLTPLEPPAVSDLDPPSHDSIVTAVRCAIARAERYHAQAVEAESDANTITTISELTRRALRQAAKLDGSEPQAEHDLATCETMTRFMNTLTDLLGDAPEATIHRVVDSVNLEP
jgi:transcriptional regulator with XRE-family HTH domain